MFLLHIIELVIYTVLYFLVFDTWTTKPENAVPQTRTIVILASIFLIPAYHEALGSAISSTAAENLMLQMGLTMDQVGMIFLSLVILTLIRDIFYIFYFRRRVQKKGYLLPHYVNLAFTLVYVF